ncbi:hypothetical protein F2Q68_00017036 [Brassica cretica]|uniref:NAD(+) kinase n=1 Tax=Brassica cretica TaxID=69181 RepID=A0A8S9HMV5_BRACR|nr:hypothetical protein F2Q68_00017036 [Brassica cretica]
MSSLAQSEKAVQEFLIQQTPMQATDDHLIEFSEALRAVAKALRGSSEGKALAQAEAAEWKRRYELERCKNLELLLKAPSNGVCADESNSNGMMDHSAKSPRLHVQENGKSGMHSLERICAHEVLQDCEPNSPNGCNNKLKRKASFKLSWGCKGHANDQHKKEIVSFESGNITTPDRSSKQISLTWESSPQTVIIFTKPNSTSVRVLSVEMVRWLRDHKGLNVYVEPRVKAELLSESSDGLILSTTSGSTAYSLAAGGSMVHPQVPGILFTPICPHSLSFRPLILPDHVTVRVQVPFNSRGSAWVSFDGKGRKQLEAGDALVCSMAPWPVSTACQVESTHDFLRSIHEGLHWNQRKIQSSDGPQ